MKIVWIVMAIGGLVATVGGIGYGLVSGYEVLLMQWSNLNAEWRSVLIVVAAMILVAALVITYVVSGTIHREGSRSVGRVDAYNAFVAWYSMLKDSTDQLPDAPSLVPTKNRIMLWGSNRVVRQINQLHELLAKGDAKSDAVVEKAGLVFLEIKRELGHRSMGVDRSVV